MEVRLVSARSLVNVHRHVDGPWFWDKYSARPYLGCRAGCSFCFLRGLGRRDPELFDERIEVKQNAVELLDRALARLPPDVIHCGDWQEPVERTHGLSRRMLEVILARAWPLLVVERSPLLERDLDLLQEIARRSWAGVIVSLSNVDPALKHAFEPRSPAVAHRLRLVSRLREHGIDAGVALMPILPECGDDEAHLDEAIRAARDHGAQFVIGGGLTMAGAQAARTLEAAASVDEALPSRLRIFYGAAHSPPRAWTSLIGRRVRELCLRHNVADRMPRPIAPGPLAENKRIAERLFLRAYELELEESEPSRVWAWCKAAWTVDEAAAPIADFRALPGVGERIAGQIARWRA